MLRIKWALALGLVVVCTSCYVVITTTSSLGNLPVPQESVSKPPSVGHEEPAELPMEPPVDSRAQFSPLPGVSKAESSLHLPASDSKSSQGPPKTNDPAVLPSLTHLTKCEGLELEYGISSGDWGRLSIAMQSVYRQNSCERGIKASSSKSPPDIAFTPKPVQVPGTVDFPCGERELSWMACQIKCTNSECTNALELCREDTSCSHVSVLPNKPHGFATLKRRIRNSDEELDYEDQQSFDPSGVQCDFLSEALANDADPLFFTYSSAPSESLCLYMETAVKNQIHVTVLGWEGWKGNRFGSRGHSFHLGSKLILPSALLRACKVPPEQLVLFSDDDVLLQPEESSSTTPRVKNVLRKYGAKLIVSTEHDCFPPQFESKLKSIAPSDAVYQCPNTGAWAGYARDAQNFFESFVKEIDGQDKSIQGFMDERMKARKNPMLFGKYKAFSNVSAALSGKGGSGLLLIL